jgi:hypothetical protein
MKFKWKMLGRDSFNILEGDVASSHNFVRFIDIWVSLRQIMDVLLDDLVAFVVIVRNIVEEFVEGNIIFLENITMLGNF